MGSARRDPAGAETASVSTSITAGAVSGTLFALALPPFDFWPLAWLGAAPLLTVVAQRDWRHAVAAAYACGFIAVNQAGYGLFAYSLWAGLALVALGPLWAVLPVGMICWLQQCRPAGIWIVLAPVFWVSVEHLLSSGLAIPIEVAVTQSHATWPRQFASILGSGGLGFAVIAAGAALAQAWIQFRRNGFRRAMPVLAVAALIPLSVSAYGYLSSAASPDSVGCQTRVAIIQPAIDFERNQISQINPPLRREIAAEFQLYFDRAIHSDSDLVIWPEGAGAFISMRLGSKRQRFIEHARNTNKLLFISAIDLDQDGRKHNAVFVFDTRGNFDKYDKIATVPIAERDVVPGTTLRQFATSRGSAGVLICFEVCFTDPARTLVQRGAEFLVVSTSDAAFGESNLAALHLSTSMLRAVENRRSVIHASNAGPSAVIDTSGRYPGRTRLFEKTMLSGCIGPAGGVSFFTRAGYFFPQLCALATIVSIALVGFRRHRGLPPIHRPMPFTPLLVSLTGCVLLSTLLIAANIRLIAGDSAYAAPVKQATFSLESSASASPTLIGHFSSQRKLGMAVLAYMASYYGLAMDATEAMKLPPSSRRDMSIREMAAAARSLGFSAKDEVSTPRALRTEQLPVVTRLGDVGYAVILEADAQQVVLYEPNVGITTLGVEEFHNLWNGEMLRIRPPRLQRSNSQQDFGRIQWP